MGTDDIHYCRQWLDEYLHVGGLPESIFIAGDMTRVKYLQNIAETVVFRDVIQRFNLPNANEVWRLMQLALNQMGGLTSFTNLKQRMAGERYHISSAMVRDVIGYFEDAYLLHVVEIFSMNTAVRSTNPKKFYCADHALATAAAEKFTPDWGKFSRTLYFSIFAEKPSRIYFARTSSGKEVDFVSAPSGTALTEQTSIQLWQVSYEMESPSTLEREKRALFEAMKQYRLNTSTIATYNTEGRLSHEGMQIEIIPAWKFLLS